MLAASTKNLNEGHLSNKDRIVDRSGAPTRGGGGYSDNVQIFDPIFLHIYSHPYNLTRLDFNSGHQWHNSSGTSLIFSIII